MKNWPATMLAPATNFRVGASRVDPDPQLQNIPCWWPRTTTILSERKAFFGWRMSKLIANYSFQHQAKRKLRSSMGLARSLSTSLASPGNPADGFAFQIFSPTIKYVTGKTHGRKLFTKQRCKGLQRQATVDVHSTIPSLGLEASPVRAGTLSGVLRLAED